VLAFRAVKERKTASETNRTQIIWAAPPAAPKKTGSSFLSVSMAAHAPSNNDAARTKTGAGEAIR